MNEPVTTEDLGLAAFLYANVHRILSVKLVPNTQNLKRFEFLPDSSPRAYFSGGAISARVDFAAMRDCKGFVNCPGSTTSTSKQNPNSEVDSCVSLYRR